MGDRDVSIRLSLKDGEVVRRALMQLGEDGQKALERIEASAKPASKGLLAINAVSGELQAGMSGAVSDLGAVGTGLAALGPAGLIAGTAIAGLAAALSAGLREMEMADQSMQRLSAVLESTGYASGMTADEISQFADQMERATLATAEGIMDAAAVLATFRSVSGEVFTRTIKAAQDLSAVFGQDLRSSTVQLGKALEDPIDGITDLKRVGVSFTAAQRDMIAAMVEAGDIAGAQRLILKVLEEQVGGAGASENRGLTGAVHNLDSAWGNLLDTLARSSGVAGPVGSLLKTITWGLNVASEMMQDVPVIEQIAAKSRELAGVERELAKLGADSLVAPTLRDTADRLRQELDDLVEQATREAEKRADARDGKRNAEAERNIEAQKARLKSLEDERVKLARDGAEKIAAINTQLAKDIDAARARAKLPGVDPEEVETEIVLLRDIAKRKVEAIEGPVIEARRRAVEQTAKILADMRRDLAGLADPRTAAIDAAVAKLPKEASPDERAEAADIAARKFDQKRAVDELRDALEEESKARDRGRQVALQYAEADELLKERKRELADLLARGAIDTDTYAKAVTDADEQRLRSSREAADGIRRALMDIRDASTDMAAQWEDDIQGMNQTARSAFVDITTGARSMADGLASIFADLQGRIAGRIYDRTVGAMFDGVLDGMFGSLFGGASGGGSGLTGTYYADVTHEGGVVGIAVPRHARVSAGLFSDAPRFHAGGMIGLAPGERPVIARVGERVLTEAQQDNTARTIAGLAAAAAAKPSVVVEPTVYVNAPNVTARTQTSVGPGGGIRFEVIVEEIETRLARNVSRGEGLAPTMERRWGLDPAAGSRR